MSTNLPNQNNRTTLVSAQEKDTIPPTSHLEFHKAFYDYLKHLSTISTGSIVLLAAFLEKIFAQPRWKPLIGISVAGFLITVIASVIAYSLMVLNFPRPGIRNQKWEGDIVFWAVLLTWLGFISGVTSLAIFIIRNLFI
jgi:hypothetical protein